MSDRPEADARGGILREAFHWVDERSGLRDFARRLGRDSRLPKAANRWWALGGLLAFIFVLQIATGVLLLVHFVPEPSSAFASVQHLMRDVPYGWWIRLLHAHGANWMVALVFLHLLHTALFGAYKRPRELVWLVGCSLFLLTLGSALSGYILPWSQVSYWATTVVTSSIELVPWVGHELLLWVRGGELVGAPTFRRAFVGHVVVLPALIALLVGLHVLLLRRVGLSGPISRASSPS